MPPATALALLALAQLPARLDARYRVELAGEHVGWARLALACGADGCRGSWESELRAPEEAGGGVVARRIEFEAAPDGTARAVRTRSLADGRAREGQSGAGPVPGSLAEVFLAGAAEGERRCLEVRDEESGRSGPACAVRRGAWLEGEVLGEPIRFRAEPGRAPVEVLVPGQRARFAVDPAARLPARAPRLFGTTVRPPVGSQPLCGAAPEPASPPLPAVVPRVFPDGASCRERTARYLDLAARAGLRGRHVVGVAFDGRSHVWHAWAELLVRGRWVPVDPSFGQAPAEGPRYAIARYEEGDAAARAEAGRRVLACWSTSR